MQKTTRVIIDGEVLVHPHFSGIGHYTLELLKALDAQLNDRTDLKVSVLVHFRHTDKVKAYGFQNIKVIPSPFSLRIANALKIRGYQPPLDLLYGKAVYIFPNFTTWPLLFSKSIPVIYDLSYEKFPEFADPRNQEFLSSQVKKATNRAARVLTISENSKKEIADFYTYPLEKIDVAYPAVDTKKFYPRKQDEVLSVLKKYSLSGPYVLFVGNLEPRKNLKNLLLAYEKMSKAVRSSHSLILVGAKGWQNDDIHNIITRLQKKGNSIQLPASYVSDEDLPAIYSGASVFVYPSFYEGFGIPPLEAMACGVPSVASNNSSLPEACGDAALLVDAHSTTDIATAVESLLTNPQKANTLRKKSTAQVEQFSWNSAADIVISSIKRAVK